MKSSWLVLAAKHTMSSDCHQGQSAVNAASLERSL